MSKEWKPDGYGGYKIVETPTGEITMPELDVWQQKIYDAYEISKKCTCGVESVGGGYHSYYCELEGK